MRDFPVFMGGRNNNVLDHFWWNFSCEGQNGRNNGGVMMYNYGLDHGELGEQFFVLTSILLTGATCVFLLNSFEVTWM